MRNLKLQYTIVHNTTAVDPKFIVLDPSGTNKDTIFICTETQLLSYNLDTETTTQLTEVPGVVSCEYLSLENEICIATDAGEVLLINPGTLNSSEVTFCEGGIEKMVWSPDQEVVAFVTKSRNVVVMTCTFDPISEVRLDEEAFGENAFITVGWGKKETQFHGSEGKTAAKQKTNFVAPENVNELPQTIDITWRADGAFFAVTFVGALGRMFKVFDKEGGLKFTSEKLKDLWPAIAWRPSGNWIAVPHKFPNKSTIALFEKNGLRHREIVLPFEFDTEPVVGLKWSADSDILTVETLVDGKSSLYLYTIGNYHWYLKQTLRFDGALSSYVWDNRIGEEKTMFVILPNGTLANYSWTFTIDRYQASADIPRPTESRLRSAFVGVIDGKKLLITDFRKSVIPPPMSSLQLECPSYINFCVFQIVKEKRAGEDSPTISVFIVTAEEDLYVYSLYDNNKWKLLLETSLKSMALENSQKMIDITPPNMSRVPLTYYSFIRPLELNQNGLFKFYCVQSLGTKSIIRRVSLYSGSLVEDNQIVHQTVCCLEAIGNVPILVHTIDGNISSISAEGMRSSNLHTECDPGQLCEKIERFRRNNLSGVVSLDRHQCLRVNSKTVSSDVTSFHITSNYLVFTQLAVIKFLRLSDEKIVNERKVERGSKIVTILPDDSTTILQLPRGNLEVIHPRVLCLEMVGQLLNATQYLSAMDLVRKQRINLNIICDHNIEKFLSNLNVFLQQVNPQWLNLFLSDLQNEDFTLTMYSSNYPDTQRSYPEGFRIETKVQHICEKLCQQMKAENFQKFLLPIITANVKIGNIENALEIIWQEKQNEGDAASNADDALKYLLYLVDVNQLYDVALGMYDFGLVLMVANKSQKDPREFLPFLNELKGFDDNYRKFKIDSHLKRFPKALHNLSRCGGDRFDEALGLVKTHKLYTEALAAYKDNVECYKGIAHAFGDYLRENGKFENASMMYERAGDFTQAVACARHVLDWQRCLALTKRSGAYPQDIAMSLVPLLMEHGRHEEAFELIKRFGNSFAEGIVCLLRGNLYLRAIFEARMENAELLGSIIAPHMISYKELLSTNLSSDREMFLKQKTRLLVVREKKSKEAAAEDLDESTQIDESDLLSDTTSMHSSRYTASSRGTGKTFRSSKNRRKHERKLLSLKEGNPFEDIALIDALHNHITKVYDQQAHIRDTCKALLEIVEDDHARAIQTQFRALLLLIRDSLDEIWTSDIMTTAQYVTGPNVDYAALQNEQRYAMINPVKRFKPHLNLLDWEHDILR